MKTIPGRIKTSLRSTVPFAFLLILFAGCGPNARSGNGAPVVAAETLNNENILSMDSLEKATFGAGCFWCVEAIYQSLNGVVKVESGYSGGAVKNPSYKE